MSDPRLISQLFGQADADHLETSTEHGGILDFNDPASKKNNSGNKTPVKMRVRAHAYQSIQKTRDDAFYPPPSMITHLYTALAHYHFHAQSKTNARAAGPGRVDRQLATRLPACYLVFSFINQDQLNVDYYQQGGVVIDLGMIARPQPGS